ncbi:MAG: amidase [Rhodospirillales bacterium]|nr:amidase [Rhodospirillales bacterium]
MLAATPRSAAAQVTPRERDPEYRTARELVAALADRRISAVELVEQAIARIESADGRINAVVVRDFERARATAARADAALARGERRPLLGLPMTVKESFNVAGLPTTWGIPRYKDWRPGDDAVPVSRLKAAGAVILGKTNVPLGLADWQTYNDIYGATNNPWDVDRTPGGSSGGGTAAVAAGYVALELGSDIGGSLRAPAHYCGVCSHKPSWALFPSRGHAPPMVPPSSREIDLAVVGPIARSVGDLALAVDLLAGPDEPLSAAYRLALPPARHDDLKSFRVLVIDTHPLEPTASAVRSVIHRLAERLGKAGAKVGLNSPALPDLAEMTRTYVRLLAPTFSADLPEERYRQIEASAAKLPRDDDSLAAVRARAAVQSHRDWIRADRMRARIQGQWRELFRDWDVVLCPPMPTPAFPHDRSPDMRARRIDIDGQPCPYQDQIAWPGIATVAGLPATTVPVERSDEGLPVGVQIVGPYLEDRTTLAFGALIEREFGGFVPPPRTGRRG